ncbi:predicted protein [Phaeodactylum tricornutum CCAP 1055/1]|uniref:SAP domain-containing protein n=1 Tax=Phaeodactylum tricornutum (strain CCAP 1055/1) TaxID=556484 RepID=B7G2Z2_PHATC|nr:predicted protein [Phaeodactylum tricornutum CCAP 1055/1]EEC46912.1 predicted protein [Phaeodactylum tricornutum CCAP 1055/1]|eukprot:XP_002181698.1 predicted protein [Phaeodactylum tricornutum CCAP 1055/1]
MKRSRKTVTVPVLASCFFLGTFLERAVAFLSLITVRYEHRTISGASPNSLLQPLVSNQCSCRSLRLFSGYGIATNYTWKEEAFEIDVTVTVPADVVAKNIIFQPTGRSIDLRYKSETKKGSNGDRSKTIVLLDGSRKLRGKVNLDGTYWVISDLQDDFAQRQVTVTIEKIVRTPKDDFEVVDYDWKGIYVDDTEEVLERKYDEPEKLNVREYAAKLGVDIDNIDMSMVDKTMFSSGMNLTQKNMDELTKAGYLSDEEVTQQADGTEYVTNEIGELERLSKPYEDEIGGSGEERMPSTKIPFLDTTSPWHNTIPVHVDKETNKTFVQQTRNFTRAAFAEDSARVSLDEPTQEVRVSKDANDPIDILTVKRLKDILKSQGLKTSGNKQELKDRLRKQVNSLMQGKQSPPK